MVRFRPPGTTVAIVAEKPSVARDIARVVGASQRGEGYLHGAGYVVTWAIGHLVRLAQPHEIRPEWKAWRRDLLPMLPREWPLVVANQTRDQFEVVRKILNSPKVARAVCATDAGREGELIFRYIYDAAGCMKPVSRLWVSSLTADAIRHGLDTMKDWSAYDSLADAARGRSRADWLVGMNLSRAYTLALNENFSVGRVQTPTLAMVAAREMEIRAFVPESYIEVVATFSPREDAQYKGTWFRDGVEPLQAAMRLPADGGGEAEKVVARARTGEARIESTRAETQRMAPPQLYDLTELQRHANRLYGFSAQKTLDLAQALYERHKLISYPRTDSRHLSAEVAKTLLRIVEAIREPYRNCSRSVPENGRWGGGLWMIRRSPTTMRSSPPIPPATGQPQPGRGAYFRLDLPPPVERLARRPHLVRRYRDYVHHNPGTVDRYRSSGTSVEQPGWKVLDVVLPRRKKATQPGDPAGEEKDETLPPGLEQGQQQRMLDAGLSEENASAEAVYGSDAADRHGDRRKDAGREGSLGRNEGARAGNAGHARRHHRDPIVQAVHRTAGKKPGGNREGHPADRSRAPGGKEPGDDRAMGGAPATDPSRRGGASALHRGHRAIRSGGGRQSRGKTYSRGADVHACGGSPIRPCAAEAVKESRGNSCARQRT